MKGVLLLPVLFVAMVAASGEAIGEYTLNSVYHNKKIWQIGSFGWGLPNFVHIKSHML